MADFQANPVEEEIECMFVCFDDAVDLEEHFEDSIQLAGRLVADQELSESLVNEILQQAWNGSGVVRALKAKPNVYSITVRDRSVVCGILEGNPLFGYTFSIKPWPLSHSVDDICANHAIY
ncbi:hypothetical protein D8674_037630 [Pyrus ussuriensis x Pyrus communis]|uniref:Uncharacterized protein n=1 Tax=Pyrus ussuriensis x Pyrus communis TaxID=2448454 RepID=A0A5N5GY50_9ROSA|nr:hypothetical protein D8674_037630 [Pyrus ussuriensis x Pyrus communis]